MTCPKCYSEFEAGPSACPDCGVRLIRQVSGIMKTSAVMIATGDENTFYRSVQEVPEPLRSRLIETTHGENSGTIVIADRAGKDQITQVIARRESAREDAKTRKEARAHVPMAPLALHPEDVWYAALLKLPIPGIRGTANAAAWVGIVLFLLAISLIVSVFNIH